MANFSTNRNSSQLHFVGFKDGERYNNAVKTFGQPDFIHRLWDLRAQQEIAPGDVAVFAEGSERKTPKLIAWNDSERF